MLLALNVHQHVKSFAILLTATSAPPLLIDADVVSFSFSLSKKDAFFFSNKSAALLASFFKLLPCGTSNVHSLDCSRNDETY